MRAIAKRLGLARTTVHRWLIAGPERERDDGDIWGEEHDDDYPHMPWRFDGFEDEPPPVAVSPVRGRPGQAFNESDVYRLRHRDPDLRPVIDPETI